MIPRRCALGAVRRTAATLLVAATLAPLAPAGPWAGEVAAQAVGDIHGVVRDAGSGRPLAGATVSVLGAAGSTQTLTDGSFVLPFPGANGTLLVEQLGYESTTRVFDGARSPLVIDLEPRPLAMDGLVVTGTLTEREAYRVVRPVNVLSGEALQRKLAGTVAATLRGEPGVWSSSMGPATARPVIRGMGGDRVLILEDGARVGDVSATHPDHAPAVEAASARRLEVVRGPAALLYGSNALGGVVNVVRDEIPTARAMDPYGTATVQSRTVNEAWSGSGSATAEVVDRLPVRAEVSARATDDLHTPEGDLANTDAETLSASLGGAWVLDEGHAGGALRVYRNHYGVPGGFEGGHAAGVRIEMDRVAGRVEAEVRRPDKTVHSIETRAQYSWYEHTEIETGGIFGTLFGRTLASVEGLARTRGVTEEGQGAWGLNASWEDLNFAGNLRTAPSQRYALAGFVVQEVEVGAWRLEGGLRYDHVWIRPDREELDASIGAIRSRTFGSVSGSLGLLYEPVEGLTVGGSLARAFRTPDVHELYSEGPHLAAYSYDVGNPSLAAETGTGLDLFTRLATRRVRGEVTAFLNDIAEYAYAENTGEISRVRLPVYQYRSNDARFVGAEASLDVSVVAGIGLGGSVSWVRGELQGSGDPLPMVPPLHGTVGVEYDGARWFLGSELEWASRQDRVGEFETPTSGYMAVHASAGVRLPMGGGTSVLTLAVENLTDATYRNHLSRVKQLLPEAGRGVSVTYRVAF